MGSEKEDKLAEGLIVAFADHNVPEALHLLWCLGADPNRVVSPRGVAGIHAAAALPKEATPALAACLAKGANPNLLAGDLDTITPTIVSVLWDRPEALQLLLEWGGNPEIRDNQGKSAYDYAVAGSACANVLRVHKAHNATQIGYRGQGKSCGDVIQKRCLRGQTPVISRYPKPEIKKPGDVKNVGIKRAEITPKVNRTLKVDKPRQTPRSTKFPNNCEGKCSLQDITSSEGTESFTICMRQPQNKHLVRNEKYQNRNCQGLNGCKSNSPQVKIGVGNMAHKSKDKTRKARCIESKVPIVCNKYSGRNKRNQHQPISEECGYSAGVQTGTLNHVSTSGEPHRDNRIRLDCQRDGTGDWGLPPKINEVLDDFSAENEFPEDTFKELETAQLRDCKIHKFQPLTCAHNCPLHQYMHSEKLRNDKGAGYCMNLNFVSSGNKKMLNRKLNHEPCSQFKNFSPCHYTSGHVAEMQHCFDHPQNIRYCCYVPGFENSHPLNTCCTCQGHWYPFNQNLHSGRLPYENILGDRCCNHSRQLNPKPKYQPEALPHGICCRSMKPNAKSPLSTDNESLNSDCMCNTKDVGKGKVEFHYLEESPSDVESWKTGKEESYISNLTSIGSVSYQQPACGDEGNSGVAETDVQISSSRRYSQLFRCREPGREMEGGHKSSDFIISQHSPPKIVINSYQDMESKNYAPLGNTSAVPDKIDECQTSDILINNNCRDVFDCFGLAEQINDIENKVADEPKYRGITEAARSIAGQNCSKSPKENREKEPKSNSPSIGEGGPIPVGNTEMCSSNYNSAQCSFESSTFGRDAEIFKDADENEHRVVGQSEDSERKTRRRLTFIRELAIDESISKTGKDLKEGQGSILDSSIPAEGFGRLENCSRNIETIDTGVIRDLDKKGSTNNLFTEDEEVEQNNGDIYSTPYCENLTDLEQWKRLSFSSSVEAIRGKWRNKGFFRSPVNEPTTESTSGKLEPNTVSEEGLQSGPEGMSGCGEDADINLEKTSEEQQRLSDDFQLRNRKRRLWSASLMSDIDSDVEAIQLCSPNVVNDSYVVSTAGVNSVGGDPDIEEKSIQATNTSPVILKTYQSGNKASPPFVGLRSNKTFTEGITYKENMFCSVESTANLELKLSGVIIPKDGYQGGTSFNMRCQNSIKPSDMNSPGGDQVGRNPIDTVGVDQSLDCQTHKIQSAPESNLHEDENAEEPFVVLEALPAVASQTNDQVISLDHPQKGKEQANETKFLLGQKDEQNIVLDDLLESQNCKEKNDGWSDESSFSLHYVRTSNQKIESRRDGGSDKAGGSYDSDNLKHDLLDRGVECGPITKTTKHIYVNLAKKMSTQPAGGDMSVVQPRTGKVLSVSAELRMTLGPRGSEYIGKWAHLERQMIRGFEKVKNQRLGGKAFFIYLLLEPPPTGGVTWDDFIRTIFYVGKGKSGRPRCHLHEAIKDNTKESDKVRRIRGIWARGDGITCVQAFHDITPNEAFTREAAIIDALTDTSAGSKHLTNAKRGEYHGLVATWCLRDKCRLGTVLLDRCLRIYTAEGQRQIYPHDL
ncbi:hypothetical protein AAG570_003073 [Ranatra chinensis]|uniref:Uncharacterized protein n=1 Tax=Ranatra chinensis TaxID=642074 RepID=A0ABD0Y5P8_9HEMI